MTENVVQTPEDFMFKLTKIEKEEVVAICDHLKVLKFSPQLPYAFTEQGVAMLSSVLHSERAIQVNPEQSATPKDIPPCGGKTFALRVCVALMNIWVSKF